MEVTTDIRSTREVLRNWRGQGQRVALVPTMGNLHRGHLALVEEALRRADRVVAGIFVNPMQFGPAEDFARYPRTLVDDQSKLQGAGVDLLFAPGVGEIYPRGSERQTRVEVPELSDILCGARRPGHFTGVATVVAKLFNIVQPDVALFGEKDYQQLLVIRRMAEDLCFPTEIVGVPTWREADGLAMSSRNWYLTPEQRTRAPFLYRTLRTGAERLCGGASIDEVERRGLEALRAAGLEADYFEVRRAEDLQRPTAADRDRVILAAAWLGRARLIDNLCVSCPEAMLE